MTRQRTKTMPRFAAFTDQLLRCLWDLVFHCHRDLQGLCRIQLFQTSRTLDHLHSLACGLRSHLCRLATDPGPPYAGRPMAHRRHHLRDRLFHDSTDPLIRL
jgi:hypothetical protein